MDASPAWLTFRYHEETKHHFHRYAKSLGFLDWASQPNPFRFYEGQTPLLLPLLKKDPGGGHLDLYDRPRNPAWDFEVQSVAAFLELSLGLSAWKQTSDGAKWALRMNASSGNLHPTEAHLLLPPLGRHLRPAVAASRAMPTDDDELWSGGLYHYNPYLHALEPRGTIGVPAWARVRTHFQAPGFFIALTSIYWREAWKYGERALRYCHHDVGHALAALSFAGNLLGWRVTCLSAPSDADMRLLLGFDSTTWPEGDDEQPDVFCFVSSATVAAVPRGVPSDILRVLTLSETEGRPNRLSETHQGWPIIEETAAALKKPRTPETSVKFPEVPPLLQTPSSSRSAAQLIRQRRSAVEFDGVTSMSRASFLTVLDKTLPRNGWAPFDTELGDPLVHLLLFVHRVPDLESGLYFFVRNPADLQDLKRSCRREFSWKGVEAALPLYQLKTGDFAGEAARMSCHQSIAGQSAFSLGMIAKFRTVIEKAPWKYKHLFWECGMIGQTLYLEAEAQGLRGTGIGCFFDEAVHEVLGVQQQSYQSLYHFTIGGPVEDTRLTTLPAYHHLPRDRQ
jgi:nitroreductase